MYIRPRRESSKGGRILAMWRSGSDRMVNEKSCNIRLDEIGRRLFTRVGIYWIIF